MSALRILVNGGGAAELTRELAIPHTLGELREGQGDGAIAVMLAETDVFVSAVFKPAWRGPPARGPRLVHSDGAGVDAIDFASLPTGCQVCNVHGHERGLAEHVVMLMLALRRNLLGMDAALRRGNWTPQRPYLSEMRDRNLLVLGLGHVGSEVARWGRFMEMRVRALTRSPAKARPAGPGLCAVGALGELDAHLPGADFVVVAIPAAEGTVDLIGGRQLQRMKPEAFIVNVGRARVINEAALYEALRARRIAGAGLDVWYRYPDGGEKCLPSRLPFQDLDNVIMTPHKPTAETMAYRWREIGKNIGRLARGEPLHNLVGAA